MKLRIRFKDSDLIFRYLDDVCPDDESAKADRARQKIKDAYFEFCDYGMVEIDTETGAGRLVPKKEWNKR